MQEATNRLEAGLRQAIDRYDLDRRELAFAQRQITRLRRAGLLPGTTEYWESTAVPRASVLVDASLGLISDEADQVHIALERFLVAASRSALEPWISGADGQAAVQRSGRAAIDRLVSAIPLPDGIDDLGEWWQNQLHRRALLRAVPQLLVSRQQPATVIGQAELALLDSPPWNYGDRLLSAFELAHGEIRTEATRVANRMMAQVAEHRDGRLIDRGVDGVPVINLAG